MWILFYTLCTFCGQETAVFNEPQGCEFTAQLINEKLQGGIIGVSGAYCEKKNRSNAPLAQRVEASDLKFD